MTTIMAEASTTNLHFCKLRECPSRSLPLAFYVTFIEQQNESILRSNNIVLGQRNPKRNLVIYCTTQPEPQPLPSQPKQDPWWRNWSMGAILSLVLPFSSNQIDPMVKIRSEFATTLQITEEIVELIERGATGIETAVHRRLEDEDMKKEGVPRSVMVKIEKAAEKLAKKARSVDYVIDTIQDIFLLESPDNNHSKGVYRGANDKKGKATKVDEEENDRKGKTIKVDNQEKEHGI